MNEKIENRLSKEVAGFLKQSRIQGHDSTLKDFTFRDFLENKVLIIKAIRAGIPYPLFQIIQDFSPFSENDWADFLDISTKSLQRYKAADTFHFRAGHSEKIISIAEFTANGLEVFGSMDKLKLWLNTPVFALGNMKPAELLKDSYGKDMVMGELTRINHGIFA